jgi:dynein heavy chain
MKIMESIEKICRNPVMDISFVVKVIMTLNIITGILRPLV